MKKLSLLSLLLLTSSSCFGGHIQTRAGLGEIILVLMGIGLFLFFITHEDRLKN